MTLTDNNLFMMGEGASEVNMPMMDVYMIDRTANRRIEVSSLTKPVDIVLERTGFPFSLSLLPRVSNTNAREITKE